jgi:biopolymer transport protein ExbD
MKRLPKQFAKLIALSVVLLVNVCVGGSQGASTESKPVVLSVQMENGRPLYKLNGKTVEDRRENSLLNSLAQVVTERGNKTPVFVIVDERVPFTDASKLQTALDKIDMPNRRLFIADFPDGTMNEIHWEPKTLPIPKD